MRSFHFINIEYRIMKNNFPFSVSTSLSSIFFFVFSSAVSRVTFSSTASRVSFWSAALHDVSSSVASAREVITLKTSFENKTFENLKNFIFFVNEHAGSQEYAVVIVCSKLSKKKIKRKMYLRCDREEKSAKFFNKKRQHINICMTQYPFSIIAKLNIKMQ